MHITHLPSCLLHIAATDIKNSKSVFVSLVRGGGGCTWAIFLSVVVIKSNPHECYVVTKNA